jgi:hypothetical protein
MKNTLSLLLFPSISYRTMIKRTFLALALMGSAATAAPYAVIERSSDFKRHSEFSSSMDFHVGHDYEFEKGSWFFQGGPTGTQTTDTDPSFDWSIKAGGERSLSRRLDLYGEMGLSMGNSETDDAVVSTELGLKYSFK